MHRLFYYDNNPECKIWDHEWASKTIEHELEACDIESPPRELFLSYLPREGKIIDAGCGFGKWVIYLKRRGYDIVGIDNNEMAIAKLRAFDESLQVQLGDILNLHYADSTFDAYISMGVIEHFEDGPLSALKEAHRVVKPNGLIFVSTPTVNFIRRLGGRRLRNAINALPVSIRYLQSNWRKSKRTAILSTARNLLPARRGAYYHFTEYRFSRPELEGFLKESGFEIMETVPHDHYDSKDHAIGLAVDFPFLMARNSVNFQLNPVGKLVSRTLDWISPWIACASILCVGRSLKEQP